MKKLIFIGYMGCGKSTISVELSKKLKIPAVDLDQIIEKNQNLSVQKIFETKGELFFRKLENQLFTELIQSNEQLIISTGGGTPCYFNNHLLLKNDGVISIYLKATIETLFSRLNNNLKNRPLLSNFDEIEAKEFIAKHLFERNFYYNQASKIINVDHLSVAEIVTEINTSLT
jgi:shikimate kinase